MSRRKLYAFLPGILGVALVVAVAAQGANGRANSRAVCPGPPSGYAHCHALVVTDRNGNPAASSSPTGLAPATIKSVYNFPISSMAGAARR
jgi:hypothetical protein